MTGETTARTCIAAQIMQVRERIEVAAHRVGRATSEITWIAVAKTVDPSIIREAVIAGIRDLGENKVQEAAGKVGAFSDRPDFRWHLIGHLQRNKVRRA